MLPKIIQVEPAVTLLAQYLVVNLNYDAGTIPESPWEMVKRASGPTSPVLFLFQIPMISFCFQYFWNIFINIRRNQYIQISENASPVIHSVFRPMACSAMTPKKIRIAST